MNYEVNSFQNYESITIDELKDQANSLLNLVTEEQRPLRVCMNNGKEFLLFPQDLLAPICDSDFRLILLSAMRYAMGKNTCMPVVVSNYIKRHIRLLDDKFLVLAADDIRRYLKDYAEHEPNSNLWQSLLGVLETEQRARKYRKKYRFLTKMVKHRYFPWSEWRDLNSRPLDPQSSALPTAPHPDDVYCSMSA